MGDTPGSGGPPGPWRRVLRVGELAPGETRKFTVWFEGREEEAFVVNHEGVLHAWVNRCLHVPMTLDWVENRFLTEDRRFILCATHGARYRPDTGECVVGPPCGKFLIRVPLAVRDGEVFAGPPGAGAAAPH